MTNQRWQDEVGTRSWRRAAGALAALIALVVGVPLLLIALTRSLPLDASALAPSAWARADDGALLLFVLLGVAWIAWASILLSVAVELWSALRFTATPRIPGLAMPQRLASGLIAAVLVALGAPASSGAPLLDDSVASAGVAAVSAPDDVGMHPAARGNRAKVQLASVLTSSGSRDLGPHDAPPPEEPDGHMEARPAQPEPTSGSEVPTITTKRHDTLWLLAEQYLGAGQRYTEIVELNRGVPQPDGRSLRGDGRIYPGWSLVLPSDALIEAPRQERHRVVAGDTLWAIADDELGDPARFREIFELNADDRQPDGSSLTDPDLIQPGWVLELPEVDSASAASRRRSSTAEVPQRTSTEAAAPRLDRSPDQSQPGGAAELAAESHGAADADGNGAGAGQGGSLGSSDETAIPLLDRMAPAQGQAAVDPLSPPAPNDIAGPAGKDGIGPAVKDGADVVGKDIAGPGGTDGAGPAPNGAAGPAPNDAAGPAAPSDALVAAPPVDPASGGAILTRGGVLASLLLAGIGAELIRRRRQYQRYRRPAERMPTPGRETQETQDAARAALSLSSPELLNRALTQLADSSVREGVPVPDVRLVRLGTDSIILELSSPGSVPLAPFLATDPQRWRLDADQLDESVVDGPRALPGLVTLGISGGQTILVNLESVGTVSVSGPGEVVSDVLRGLAAELAFGPAGETTERTLCVADPSIAAVLDAGSIAVETDLDAVTAMLTAAMVLGSPGPGASVSAGSPPAVEAMTEPISGDPLQIVLADRPLEVAVGPHCGCGLITSAEVPMAAGASLAVDRFGSALLLPEQVHLTPQRLSSPAADDLVQLVGCTELPTPAEVEAPDDLSTAGAGGATQRVGSSRDVACGDPGMALMAAVAPAASGAPAAGEPDVIDLRDAPVGGAARQPEAPPSRSPGLHQPSGQAPHILLLGEVRVENAHGKAESTRIGRLAETAAFVLLHPGSRPSELQSALWPGRRSNPQTCRQMISRTRTWLGRTASGTPHLMPFATTEGRLRLSSDVTSDWSEFQRLAQIGLADPQDTEHLAAALALVRGRPFGAVAARELPWADLHINEMISAITDVAYVLATRLEEAGRPRAAHDAALRGLLTESEAEMLEEVAARTAP